jgi:hypothetical protein
MPETWIVSIAGRYKIMQMSADTLFSGNARLVRRLFQCRLKQLVDCGLSNFIRAKWVCIRKSTSLLVALNLTFAIMTDIRVQPDVLAYASSSGLLSNQNEKGILKSPMVITPLPPREVFDIISDRPLLVPERRMPTSPIIESEAFVIELIGTYIDDMERTALVKLGDQDSAVWVREREFISSWQVEEIRPDRLLLRSADELRVVYLWPDRNLAQQG